MNWRYGLVSLLSCTVPKLVSHLKFINHSVIKTKIVTHCQDGLLDKLISDKSLDQRSFTCCTGPHKTYLYIFVNFFGVFLEDLHERVVYGIIFTGNYKAITYPTFFHSLQTILTDCVTARDDSGFSGFYVVPEEATYALHKRFLNYLGLFG